MNLPTRIDNPGGREASIASVYGEALYEELKNHEDFYFFSPDETTSNKFDKIFDELQSSRGRFTPEILDLINELDLKTILVETRDKENRLPSVTIDNVTATAANYTVNVAASAGAAKVTINNSTLNGLCTVNVAAAGAKVTVDNSTVNCNDNNTTAGESYAALCLNKAAVGGSIIATNTTVNVTAGSDSEKGRNGAENGTVTINGSTEGVTVTVAVITYPGSDYYYGFTSLADAIEFAKAGDTITLIRDVTTSETINITKDVTIDGNGHTLTYKSPKTSAGRMFGSYNGKTTHTFVNGTIDNQSFINAFGAIVIMNAGNLVMEDLVIRDKVGQVLGSLP